MCIKEYSPFARIKNKKLESWTDLAFKQPSATFTGKYKFHSFTIDNIFKDPSI